MHQPPGSDITKQPRNLDPAVHPFERAREYTRALNATKLERMFAKPFIGQLGRGHVDGVYTMAKDPGSMERFASGSGDGVVKVWDLPTRDEVWQTKCHDNIVKGMCWTLDRKILSCGGVDRTIALHDPYNTPSGSKPVTTYQGKNAFTSLSHHRTESTFAASHSAGISIYDVARSTSHTTLTWPTTVDTITTCAFSPVENPLIASADTTRAILLHDLRTPSTPIARTVLSLATNSISWSPMEAFNIAAASEDHNIYLFDVRNFSRALNVLKDHVSAVMDVSWSPTGEELVSASYDRTVRLWRRGEGHSRDVYHTKRMQRVFRACFTDDASYVLSGSDDGNIRIWRAVASSRGGVKSARQRQSLEYAEALKARYGHMPEIRRIARHRHVPKVVKKASEIKRDELAGIKRREENRRKHEAKTFGKGKRRSEREKMVLASE